MTAKEKKTVPFQAASLDIWDKKYRLKDRNKQNIDEDMEATYSRVSKTLVQLEEPKLRRSLAKKFRFALENGAIPAGRIMSNAGAGKHKPATSTINCTVSSNIPDSMDGILSMVKEAGLTLKAGCGIGYEFSTLRPKGAYVAGAGAYTSGPLSFMDIYDKMCFTVSSAGGRRGAQMATFDINHPDIVEFIRAKREDGRLRQFNMSCLVTKDFMEAVDADDDWKLSFPVDKKDYKNEPDMEVLYRGFPIHNDKYIIRDDGQVLCKVYKTIKARRLMDVMMVSTYDYAEPGFILIDEYNEMNNNWWCENIRATNPSLANGTLVHTKKGIFPIEKLENKKFLVRAIDGSWDSAHCWLSGESEVTKEIFFGPHQSTRSTLKHKWPVLNRITGKITRTLTSDLKVGDEIPKNNVESFGIEGDTSLTEDEGFFLGLWLADGHLTKRDSGEYTLGMTFNKLDSDLAERALKYINSLSLKKAPSSIKECDDSLTIQLTSKPVIEYLISRLGLHCGEKKFPTIVWTSNDLFIGGFVDGLISGDGYVAGKGKQHIVFRQRSESVTKGLAKLFSFVGIVGNLKLTSRASSFPNGKDYKRKCSCWDYRISKISGIKFSMLFSLTCKRKQMSLDEIGLSEVKKGLERDLFCKITEINDGADGEPVWDVSVNHPQHLFPIQWTYTGNCGEQGLPENGACLLGSVNLTKFVRNPFTEDACFDWEAYRKVITIFSRMLDNVVEINGLPLESQRKEIEYKRRHGMGYLGLGSALAMLRVPYGSEESVSLTRKITYELAVTGLRAGLELAKEKGAAPIMNDKTVLTTEMLTMRPEMVEDGYKVGQKVKNSILWAKYSRYNQKFLESGDEDLIEELAEVGCRYTHHSSIAPTGTISLSLANNASNGIEPSFAHHYARNIIREGKKSKEKVDVFSFELLAYRAYINEKAMPFSDDPDEALPDYFIYADQVTPKQHVDIQAAAQEWIDSSISKTANVPTDFDFEEFKDIYMYAYRKGLKGCTTFRFNPEVHQGVLVKEEDLANTEYKFNLADGTTVTLKGNEEVFYDGEMHNAANLYDALKEGFFGKF